MNHAKLDKSVDYKGNLRRVLGWEDSKSSLMKYFGYLKGTSKKGAVAMQREMRKEWDLGVKKLQRTSKK